MNPHKTLHLGLCRSSAFGFFGRNPNLAFLLGVLIVLLPPSLVYVPQAQAMALALLGPIFTEVAKVIDFDSPVALVVLILGAPLWLVLFIVSVIMLISVTITFGLRLMAIIHHVTPRPLRAPFVLFLRPFSRQQAGIGHYTMFSLPFVLARAVSRPFMPWRMNCRIVCIADQRSALPLSDSHGIMASDEDWKGKVAYLCHHAFAVILFLGGSEGIRWELRYVVSNNLFGKTIFLLPRSREAREQALRIVQETLFGTSLMPDAQEFLDNRNYAMRFVQGRAVLVNGGQQAFPRSYRLRVIIPWLLCELNALLHHRLSLTLLGYYFATWCVVREAILPPRRKITLRSELSDAWWDVRCMVKDAFQLRGT